VVFGGVLAGEVENDDDGHGASLLSGLVDGSKAGQGWCSMSWVWAVSSVPR